MEKWWFQSLLNNLFRHGDHEQLQKVEVPRCFPQHNSSVTHTNVYCEIEPGRVVGAFQVFLEPVFIGRNQKYTLHEKGSVRVIRLIFLKTCRMTTTTLKSTDDNTQCDDLYRLVPSRV